MKKLNSKNFLLSMASATIFVGGVNSVSASGIVNTYTGAVTAGTADLALSENHALCAFGGAGTLTAHPNITLPKGKFSFIAGTNSLTNNAANTFAPVDGSDISFVGGNAIDFGSSGAWTQPTSGAVTYQLRGVGAVTLPDAALADAVTGFELFINAYAATTLNRATAGTLHATINYYRLKPVVVDDERFRTIERVFAWEDKFKRLLIRFEHINMHHFGLKLIAYTMINLRHFSGK